MNARLKFDDFQHVVLTGRGKMPAYPDLDAATLKALYDFCATAVGGRRKVPLGEDPAAAQGAKNTGVFGLKSGAVVTSTGLIFVALRNGKVRAYDDATGKVLWTATLPAGSEGIPAMYEANGRQYLVVSASSKISSSRSNTGPVSMDTLESGSASSPGAYVAFAIPKR